MVDGSLLMFLFFISINLEYDWEAEHEKLVEIMEKDTDVDKINEKKQVSQLLLIVFDHYIGETDQIRFQNIYFISSVLYY